MYKVGSEENLKKSIDLQLPVIKELLHQVLMFLNYHLADEISHSDFLLSDLLHLISQDQNLSKVEKIFGKAD